MVVEARQGRVTAAYSCQPNAEAVKWFRLAAEQGNANAQQNFGFMYLEGRGVPQDFVEAMKWFAKWLTE